MFNKNFKHALAYIKNNGFKSLVYKIYKKTMYIYYNNKLKFALRTSASTLETDILEYPKIIPFEETVMQKNINSKVSIILLFEGIKENLESCLDSISTKTTYKNYEIIIIAFAELNDSMLGKRKTPNTKVVSYDKSFGFSNAVNATVKMVEGEYIVLLSVSIEIVSPNWIEELQRCITSPDVGVAGAMLLSLDNTVQQVDVKPKADEVLEVLAVTRSCLMMETDFFIECEGLNEYFFNSYADIDLCLRVREMDKTVHCTPKAIIRKINNKDEEAVDLIDKALFLNCWEESLKIKPYLQKNLFIGV
jgi:glycosyltransferase involved in cell wall biosynthesis